MLNAYQTNTLVFDSTLCNGCALCVAVCPHAVFAMDGRRATLVQAEACMECGACQKNCVTGAITVESGVGCASAMISAALKGQQEVSCGGPDSCDGSCSCS
jgi:NAD-dependent dihydropyrimidine dehydrogenase PreA subunit